MAENDKRKKGKWSEEDMKTAINEVMSNRMSQRQASEAFCVPKTTLWDRLRAIQAGKTVNLTPQMGRYKKTFDESMEKQLVYYIKDLDNKFMPLSRKEFLKLTFDLAEHLQVPHQFNRNHKVAGKQFYYDFMARHPELSLRTPESTSIQRALEFNKHQILISVASVDIMEEPHKVFLPIPDVAVNEEFLEENLPDEDILHEDVPSVVTKEEVNVEESSNDQCMEQCSSQDITTVIIKEENVLEEQGEPDEQGAQELSSLAALSNDFHEEANTFYKCEEYSNGSHQNESDSFPSSVTLKKSRTVKTKAKYHCDVCTKKFTQESSLLKHKLTHDTSRRFQCDICNKDFTKSGQLSQHKLSHAKKYHCDVCKKVFTRTYYLAQHKSMHDGVMNYHCEICKKAFYSSGSLWSHKLKHADNKKYQCNICSKTFAHSGSLWNHKLIHADAIHRCDVCNKAFTFFSCLVRHKLIHSGKKNYRCDVCNKTFTQASGLSQHKSIHAGIKNYQCHICNKAFTHSSNLSKHKLIHSTSKE